MDTRGVTWSFQAVIFLVVILGALTFAASSIPTEDRHDQVTDLQREQITSDVLDVAVATGAAANTTLYWNASSQEFVNASGPNGTYTTLNTSGSHPLWPAVKAGIASRQLAYNIDLGYQIDLDSDGILETQYRRLVSQGPPGQNAVVITETVFLDDSDVPRYSPPSVDGDPCTLGEMGDSTTTGTNGCQPAAYFAPDTSPSLTQYNTLQIRVTVWSM